MSFGGSAPQVQPAPPAPREDDPAIEEERRKTVLAARNRQGRAAHLLAEDGRAGGSPATPAGPAGVARKLLLGQG